MTVLPRALAPLVAFIAALLALAMPAAAYEDGEDLDPSVFYQELDQHGRWVQHPKFGYVFSPEIEDDDGEDDSRRWRPYTRGHWVNTEEYGWYWVSDEPFGWATYHYGRWAYDEDLGWLWVPGRRWGPAWVAWRHSDEHVGWAPLPPESDWEDTRGLGLASTFYDEPRYAPLWFFVAPRYLTTPRLWRHGIHHRHRYDLFGRTRPATNYIWRNNRIVNRGLEVSLVERLGRRPVPTTRLVLSSNRGDKGRARLLGTNTVKVFRPTTALLPPAGGRPPAGTIKGLKGTKGAPPAIAKTPLVAPRTVVTTEQLKKGRPAFKPLAKVVPPATGPAPATTTTTPPGANGRVVAPKVPPSIATPPVTKSPAQQTFERRGGRPPAGDPPPVVKKLTPPPAKTTTVKSLPKPVGPPPAVQRIAPPPKVVAKPPPVLKVAPKPAPVVRKAPPPKPAPKAIIKGQPPPPKN